MVVWNLPLIKHSTAFYYKQIIQVRHPGPGSMSGVISLVSGAALYELCLISCNHPQLTYADAKSGFDFI